MQCWKKTMRNNLRNIHRIFILMIAVMPLWLVFCGNADAQGKKQGHASFTSFRDIPGVTAEEIAAVEALQKRRRNFFYAMPLSAEAFVHDSGEIRGFSALFCAWLSEMFGIPFVPEIRPLGKLLAGLQSGKVDFSGTLTPTEERRSIYFMTDPVAKRALKYFRLEGSAPLPEIQKMRPVRYGLLYGSSVAANVIENHEPDTYEVVYIGNYDMVYDLLVSGKIDAFIHEEPTEAIFDTHGNVFVQDFFPVVLSPVSLTAQNPELAVIISIMQKALQHGGKNHLNFLYSQGYQEYRRHKFFSRLNESEKTYLRNHRVIPYVAEHYNYPLSFYNRHEKEWQGIVFDVLREVEMLTGLTFERVNDESVDWSVLLQTLESGKALMITELLRTEDRKSRFLWLDTPLLNNPYILISSLERPSVRPNEVYNLKIGVARNTAYVDFFHKWYPNHPLVTEYPSESAAFDALHRGEVDMVMSSTSRLLALIHHYEVTGFKANVIFDMPSFSTMGLNRDHAVLASIIDKALSLVDVPWISGQWATVSSDYQGMYARQQRLWLIAVSVLLFGIIALLSVLFYRIRQEGKRFDELVRRRTATLESVRHDLERTVESERLANQHKNAFLARMSHEIRSPVNAILGMTELALRGDITASVHQQMLAIRRTGGTLLSNINAILDFSRIAGGHMEIVPRTYLPASLIEDVISITRTEKMDSPVQFVVYIDSNLPNALYGDEVRIRQILLNLLSNAVRYTEKGYMSLRINGGITETGLLNLAIEVTDSGIGIKPEDMDKLFREFVQLDLESGRGSGGTGLGLAITHSLVKAMDGDISVTSEYGKGSTFFLTLPQKIRASEKLATVENPDKKRVLVYEPDDVYADSILYALDNLGVACTLVTSDAEFSREISDGKYSFVFIASVVSDTAREIFRRTETEAVLVILVEFGKAIGEHALNILTLPAHSISVANILNGKADSFSYGKSDKDINESVSDE